MILTYSVSICFVVAAIDIPLLVQLVGMLYS